MKTKTKLITIASAMLKEHKRHYASLALACAIAFSASAGSTMALSRGASAPSHTIVTAASTKPLPSATSTTAPTPTRTQRPTPTMTPFIGLLDVEPARFTARLSYYWPPLGGTNCHHANWRNGLCMTLLLGQPWSDWAGAGAACPPSIPLKARVYIERLKRSYYCVDRGGAIDDMPDGTKFIDLLQDRPPTFPDWDIGIIVDMYCPRGCYTSEAYVE